VNPSFADKNHATISHSKDNLKEIQDMMRANQNLTLSPQGHAEFARRTSMPEQLLVNKMTIAEHLLCQ